MLHFEGDTKREVLSHCTKAGRTVRANELFVSVFCESFCLVLDERNATQKKGIKLHQKNL